MRGGEAACGEKGRARRHDGGGEAVANNVLRGFAGAAAAVVPAGAGVGARAVGKRVEATGGCGELAVNGVAQACGMLDVRGSGASWSAPLPLAVGDLAEVGHVRLAAVVLGTFGGLALPHLRGDGLVGDVARQRLGSGGEENRRRW